ncbi:hypothetical protein IJG14_04510 [bacterium]|nr:hypothetical protein [bacterium]
MGLASSQARLLLLTARKSDLEYRAQMISQRKINLAMQSQQLALDYSQKRSNRQMDLVYYTDSNTSEVYKEKLSYQGLMALNNKTIVGDFLVKTTNGKYVISGNSDEELLESQYNVAYKLAQKEGNDPELIERYVQENGAGALISRYASQMQFVKEVSNADFFQSALRNGSLYLEKADSNNEYHTVGWGSLDCINDSLYTEDDAAAEAEYEAKSLTLSNQDKMLDLELTQIQTQHKAIETEYDSVKKVIEKNIDVSYKIFA